ncbi:hypothetical protein C7B62_23500 [Pleurocapsa sp. CCALA 161]|uniref:hypothetical protein n=1 Tax=Pleurocapsa sp. CCALA 161 TaxID=2107688 RepID=UPI000D081C51|nr:hypothetical protein [Pleurocapsa sp. CCALA 161]PSB06183.1 hypothetical protein C7B62_23500 [Pleurocapsa sp. CCALA 161]
MIIYDLEFFNSCGQENEKNEATIRGGASSSSESQSSVVDGKTFSITSIEGEGDDVYSISIIGDKVVKKRGKKRSSYKLSGYSVGSYELIKELDLG